jgi:hypothetical protein
MPDYEPIEYRLRCHTKRSDLPADVLRDINEAYSRLLELEQERDEARREVCEMGYWELKMPSAQFFADMRGWRYLNESK